MEDNNKGFLDGGQSVVFEIKGNDYEQLKRFQKQHNDCEKGFACEQFTYSFIPTGIGLATTVKCSCGQELMLGDFMDFDAGEYDEEENQVLTEEDIKNKVFEEAAYRIMLMKNPRYYQVAFADNQDFDKIYSISAYGIASVTDERISKCIMWKNKKDENGIVIDNYKGLDEKEKINAFYDYFEARLKEELFKYNCRNQKLLNMLGEKEGL